MTLRAPGRRLRDSTPHIRAFLDGYRDGRGTKLDPPRAATPTGDGLNRIGMYLMTVWRKVRRSQGLTDVRFGVDRRP